jgi:GDP-L-fucose synthase
VFLHSKVVVTGGAGFLGMFVVERLRSSSGTDVFVPRSRDFNLVDGQDVARLLDQTRPDLVVHLAAVVGGIGHNQRNPGRFSIITPSLNQVV